MQMTVLSALPLDSRYSRRTFNNHRIAILDIFGIDIECDRGTNRYSIHYSDEALDKNKSVNWLIDTFTVNNLLTLGKERLSGRVGVEEIPSGRKFLTPIMQAMEDGMELEIVYGKYTSSTSETLHVQPFAVKEHERRWYLIGFCHERAHVNGTELRNNDMRAWRVYGLDRIQSLSETETSFKMPKGFDVENLFRESFGVFFGEFFRWRRQCLQNQAHTGRESPHGVLPSFREGCGTGAGRCKNSRKELIDNWL